MIKFLCSSDEGLLIGVGLSYENIDRLKEGKPILMNLSEIGAHLGLKDNLKNTFKDVEGDGKMLIFAGKTEESMKDQMQEFFPDDYQFEESSGNVDEQCDDNNTN